MARGAARKLVLSGVLAVGSGAAPVRGRALKSWRVAVPADFVLWRDVCSYGYFLLEPNLWLPGSGGVRAAGVGGVFRRIVDLGAAGPARLEVTQPEGKGADLSVVADTALYVAARHEATAQLTRMLRLDEAPHNIAAFHSLDRRYKKSGRGRLFRSATFFEDVIKTVTNCNVTWLGTMSMNRRLCGAFGAGGAFPTPARLAAVRPAALRAQCGVGYRDARIVQLAEMFESGAVDEAWFADLSQPDDVVRDALIELPGIGPYAAANILQLLGRYGHVPLDTESVRHGRTVLAMRGSSESIMKRVGKHFAGYGEQRFRSYWFELWECYELLRGPAWTWEREKVGATFTAAGIKKAMAAKSGESGCKSEAVFKRKAAGGTARNRPARAASR